MMKIRLRKPIYSSDDDQKLDERSRTTTEMTSLTSAYQRRRSARRKWKRKLRESNRSLRHVR
ncbi:hypothetical protein HanIR_Chr16g0828941 [Helianthus annuus]|nr:hypothetical protein HanIR_Chr16g0828941 [Helianthus annuus]